MFKRMAGVLQSGVWGLLLAGCATKPEPAEPAGSATAATARMVTIHVAGMIQRQNITWMTWPNRVHEALAGLPGIVKVDVDLKKDLCHITYDPKRVTQEQMLETIRTQGFEGNVEPAENGR